MYMFMSSWSIALCGWFERSWQSTASLSVKSYLVATFLLFSCVGLYWGGRVVIDYLLTFIECVKYTSFALTSCLVSKFHSFIQTMPWSTRGMWSLWPCTLCTIVYILPQYYLRFQPSIVSLCRWEEDSSDWVWERMRSEKDGDFTLCVYHSVWFRSIKSLSQEIFSLFG